MNFINFIYNILITNNIDFNNYINIKYFLIIKNINIYFN